MTWRPLTEFGRALRAALKAAFQEEDEERVRRERVWNGGRLSWVNRWEEADGDRDR